ncbi:type IV pilus assembly protein PilM [Uruburuella testudinis]|uniref:Type IV pilus assembly protein PilM n=1 Tax=Uruburuella testudinis TaxID=1282863 RepID=A0ABY4DUI2_9NEIS|nr:type IV pilus assembly protein PilM [Uruburuella testudinis]UOO82700.1 type IV pilus assembly protein PilM [Uruburuella testudinis]
MPFAKKQKNTSSKPSSSMNLRTAIGVDISQHAIKMVQISGRSLNQIQLEKYVITKLPKNIIKGNKIQDYEQLVAYLQHSYTQLQTPSKNIIAALPQSLATVETTVYNAKETEFDLEDFAEFEISQIAPIEEINYDYQVTGVSVIPAGQHILLAAAKKDDVEPRIELFETAGLPLSVMDVDLFAQNNAFSFWINQHAPELANEKIAVFGIYATQMYALIVQSGQILYKQETSVSNEQLNQLIQRTYQVTEEKADQMINAVEKPSDYQMQVADRFNIQVAQEIQRVLQFYYTTQSNEQFTNVKHIMLTGNASLQSGLPETIFSQTNTATECVHPAIYAPASSKVDLSQLQIDAPSLTLAFGLALRGL